MKLLTCLIVAIALVTPLLAQTPIRSAAEMQAAKALNEAARAYREGNFAEAQAHSERALLLDPRNRAAPFFVARTIHAQYKPGDFTPENVLKAREAILAYQKILDRTPADDEAYKAVAYLYAALKDDELQRQWILQRAGNVSFPNEKRAEAYIALAAKDWDCSYQVTEKPANKVTAVTRNKKHDVYQMPQERVNFERANECANRGLEMVNMAIALTPDSEPAWFYKTNMLLELAKLAEMSKDIERKTEFSRQHKEALKESLRLSKRSQSNP